LAKSRFSHYYHNDYTCGGPSPSVFSETNNESTAVWFFHGYMTHRSGHNIIGQPSLFVKTKIL